jgi:hypothetical protein
VRDIQLLATDGAIIVAEIAEKITEEVNTQEYYRKLYNRIEVRFDFWEHLSKLNSNKFVLIGE